MTLRCERCGREFSPGTGRYILTMTFTADVEFELHSEAIKGNIADLLEEIERIPEEELTAQVYQKRSFIICRPCKEKLAENPFGLKTTSPDRIQ